MKNNIPIRVLQIIPSAYQGSGILQVVLNWHRHIDKTKVQFDYLFSKPTKNSARDEIEKLGGRIYELPHPYKRPVQFLCESYRFFKERQYHTVHSHMTNLNLIFYPLAKWFGAKNIIQHSHSTSWGISKLSAIRNYVMLHCVWPFITHKIACSQLAGKTYFGNDCIIINNGIDTDKFIYSPAVRELKRKELKVEKIFVIGHIGRFSNEKNHKFLIEILADLIKKDDTAKLLLVGAGPLEEEIKQLVCVRQLQDKVIFLGVRKDIPELLQAFDVLCMPSFYEGLPVVGLEAQNIGVPCVFADTITKEILLLPDSKMISLKDNTAKWAEVILSLKQAKRRDGKEILQKEGFDIRVIAANIYNFYNSLESLK